MQGSAGGIVVYGRSDNTLNPSGIRIGTAEIYRIVEAMDGVEDSIVIRQPWQWDVRVVLLVKLSGGVQWSNEMAQSIQSGIRAAATPRHVPARIAPVDKIPYTISGKKVELTVRDFVMGVEPKNKAALADPTAFDCYQNLEVLNE